MMIFSKIYLCRWFMLYLLATCLVWIAGQDARTHRISNRSVLAFGALAVAYRMLCPELSCQAVCIGVFAVSVPLLLLAAWKPGAVGGGDVKLMAAAGSLFGANGIWQAFFTGILLAGIWTIVMLLCKKVKRKSSIPLGPFLSAGMLISLSLFF